MSEEEARKIIDKIKQEEFPYALAIAKAYEKLQQENKHLNNILTEFEKWLEEEIEKRKGANVLDPIQVGDYYIKIALKASLDKLKELKEGKK